MDLQNPAELSKTEADTEFQYRPHIVDTDTIAGVVFADAVSETSKYSIFFLELISALHDILFIANIFRLKSFCFTLQYLDRNP